MLTFGGLFYSIFVKVFYKKTDLADFLAQARIENKRIGFVPTMGALHAGHLALLSAIKPHCDLRVCSVFVNPTQFNNQEDLLKYPRPVEQDIALLREQGCDVVFLPSVEEMYGAEEEWNIELGELDSIFDGEFRPGHYQGVTQIVNKLFTLVQPDVACFGQKDYQQYLVIKEMLRICELPVTLLLCPTVREPEGLALSSRNIRLSDLGRKQGLALFGTLKKVPGQCQAIGIDATRAWAKQVLSASEGLSLEYFDICHSDSLKTANGQEKVGTLVALVAAWVEGVRLIDNIIFEG
jgi:pantoate--beta-alanine ligase